MDPPRAAAMIRQTPRQRRCRCNRGRSGKAGDMAKARAASVAASSEWVGGDGIRQPGGEVHAWMPGMNQTQCGLALSRTRLRRFPHVRFDFRATDVVAVEDQIRYI